VDGGAPPLLIIEGKQDEIVPYDQAIWMKGKYESAGLIVEFVSVQNAGHDFALAGERAISPSIENIRQRTIEFFKCHLVR
jgi:predicted esterase